MAILDFTTVPSAAVSNNANNGRRQPFANMSNPAELPASSVWINLGYDIETTNAEGEVVKRFINLPYGIAIDTMREADTRGQNQDYVKQAHARNDLLKHLQAAGAKLKPGEEVVVQLAVKMRRAKSELAVASTENEYIADLSNLLIAAE